jgi:hypothetical protein
MQIEFGAYKIITHELDNKLSVQIISDLGEVTMHESGDGQHDFPNGIGCKILDAKVKPEARGLRRYSFGEYTFILGINFAGDLVLFYSMRLYVSKKVIEGHDTLTLAFLAEPNA